MSEDKKIIPTVLYIVAAWILFILSAKTNSSIFMILAILTMLGGDKLSNPISDAIDEG